MIFEEAKFRENLITSIKRFLRSSLKGGKRSDRQHALPLDHGAVYDDGFNPLSGPAAFINFLVAALPSSDVYLFGGALRDFALFGRSGFSSDLDIVVTCSSTLLAEALPQASFERNKFGGFKLQVKNQDIDVWSAPETWAFTQGYFPYEGIKSILSTTVINWDAVLLDLRGFDLITTSGFFQDIRDRHLDIRFTENPSPKTALLKILRYVSLKRVNTVSLGLMKYVRQHLDKINVDDLIQLEVSKHGDSYITSQVVRFFKNYEYDELRPINVWETLYNPQLGDSWRQ